MTQRISGISAQFPGTCPLCSSPWDKGDIIDKIPGDPDNKRGHAQCVANAKAGRPAQSQSHPAGQQYEQQPAPAAQRPAATSNASLADDETIKAFWTLRTAMTQIAQGAMMAAVAIEQIAKSKDPHHVADRAPSKDAA